MNWNWACEQLLKGEKIYSKNIGFVKYITFNEFGQLIDSYNCQLGLTNIMVQEDDWELYKEPKKWTEEQKICAKALIIFGAEYITCSLMGSVDVWDRKPTRGETGWYKAMPWGKVIKVYLRDIFGNNVKWEDEEPTRLQDIVDSEVE